VSEAELRERLRVWKKLHGHHIGANSGRLHELAFCRPLFGECNVINQPAQTEK